MHLVIQPSHQRHISVSLDAGPSPDKWGGLRQEGHPT